MPVTASEFQARFDRFRATVAEECARQTRQDREPFGELTLQRMVEQVRTVQQRAGLIGEGAGEPGMSMTERRHADTGDQVQIFASLRIVKVHTLTADDDDWGAAVRRDDMPRFE